GRVRCVSSFPPLLTSVSLRSLCEGAHVARSDRNGSPRRVVRRGVGRPERGLNRRGGSALVALAAVVVAGMADVGHVVSEGESLWLIARKYATTPRAIADANHIPNPYLIEIGRELRIPGIAPAAPPGAPPASPGNAIPPPATTVTDAVAPGEGLTLVAARYNV